MFYQRSERRAWDPGVLAPAGTVLGHEAVAELEGRSVVLVHHLPCGDCERGRAGHESTCERFGAATIVPRGFAAANISATKRVHARSRPAVSPLR